jgi:AraC family transcriptional regulator
LTPLAPRFERAPQRLLAGVRRSFSFDDAAIAIPALWMEFAALKKLPAAGSKVAYGVMCATDLDAGTMEYMAANEVTTFSRLSTRIDRLILPAGRYAVFEHAGHVRTLRETWDRIMTEWAPDCGLALAATPDFERYDEDFDPLRPGGVEIWAPIKG